MLAISQDPEKPSAKVRDLFSHPHRTEISMASFLHLSDFNSIIMIAFVCTELTINMK